MCNKLAHFNQKIESRFRVRNMKEAFEHDMELSMRAVRDAINFATLPTTEIANNVYCLCIAIHHTFNCAT